MKIPRLAAAFLAGVVVATACRTEATGCIPGELRPGTVPGQGAPTDQGQAFAGRDPTQMTVGEVVQIATDAKLDVTWRYSYETGPESATTECWCVPPPDGRVADMFFLENGQLIVFVAALEPRPGRGQPDEGWGC